MPTLKVPFTECSVSFADVIKVLVFNTALFKYFVPHYCYVVQIEVKHRLAFGSLNKKLSGIAIHFITGRIRSNNSEHLDRSQLLTNSFNTMLIKHLSMALTS